MTVAEFINELKTLNPGAKVYMDNPQADFFNARIVEAKAVKMLDVMNGTAVLIVTDK